MNFNVSCRQKINGTLVQGFVYQNQTQVIAELDANSNVVKTFIYGTKINVPDYMLYQGKEYRIISDQVGTPKMVVDTTTGAILEEIFLDEFGNPEKVLKPAVIPFGFAGGIYDRDTGLVRFGARDFDPQIGRWIAKDPIGFGGGDNNLFGYVANDPVNLIDPSGKFAIELCIAKSIYQTMVKIGELSAELDEAVVSKNQCSSKGRRTSQIKKELDSLSTLKSAYYKCIKPEIILPDQGI